MYKLLLDSCGNPDRGENPYKQIEGTWRMIVECESIEECSRQVIKYCDENGLGASNLAESKVFTMDNKYIGYISYNGRFWEE